MPEFDVYRWNFPSPWTIVVVVTNVAAICLSGLSLAGVWFGPADGEAARLEQFETRYAITVLDESAPRLPSADGERADVTLLHDGLVRDCTVFWVRDDWHVQCATRGGSTVVVLDSADER